MLRVLLVEDDPGVREGLTELLEEICEPVAASTVEEAMERLASGRFGLVLTDLSLDGLRGAGWQVAQEARRRLMPVIVVSGAADELRASCAIQGRLGKPFATRQVHGAVERFEAVHAAAQRGERIELAPGAKAPVPTRGAGLGFVIQEGRLVSSSGELSAGDFGFFAANEALDWRADGRVLLAGVSI